MDLQKELREAIMAADRALEGLERAKVNLNSARNWGIWDILGGGLISGMIKRSRMREAGDAMEYARQVDPVHPSGKKLYEFATLTLDNCAPAAEAMLEVEGIEAKFAAASGITSDYIMWSVTSVAVEKLLEMGLTPGILKSANFPGGNDYNKKVIEPHYEEFGW